MFVCNCVLCAVLIAVVLTAARLVAGVLAAAASVQNCLVVKSLTGEYKKPLWLA